VGCAIALESRCQCASTANTLVCHSGVRFLARRNARARKRVTTGKGAQGYGIISEPPCPSLRTPHRIVRRLLPSRFPWSTGHNLLRQRLEIASATLKKHVSGTSRPTEPTPWRLAAPHYAGSGRGEANGRSRNREPVSRGTVLRGGEGGAGARREGNPVSGPGGAERRGLGPESAEGKPPSTSPPGPETGLPSRRALAPPSPPRRTVPRGTGSLLRLRPLASPRPLTT